MTTLEDEPVAYQLTAASWSATRAAETLTTREVAVRRGWSTGHVSRLCRRGRVAAVQVGGEWLVNAASLDEYCARRRGMRSVARRPRGPSLPAEPLLSAIAARGGRGAVGVRVGSAEERALQRARQHGRVTLAAADRLAVRVLGLTPWEVWGSSYDEL